MGWRRITYGEWLPNTYYAKVTGAWPGSGIKYLISFILEYALWMWLVLLIFVSIVKFVPNIKTFSNIHGIGHRIKALFGFDAGGKINLPFLIFPCTILALVIHISYYTFIVGGDHFEYRVYSHLILFIFISFIWLLNITNLNKIASIVLLVTFILLSYPIPWTHWYLTKDYKTREETFRMYVPISGHWPNYFRWYAKSFDKLQFRLRRHSVCVRHQEHKIFHQHLISILPSRDSGISLPCKNFPVLATKSVGVVAWVLPKINIIDLKGLSDYVIARNKSDRTQTRLIAHEREPPEHYVECFSPNVQLLPNKEIRILKRESELTAEDIIRCEKEWFKKVGKSIDP
jgi:arabinofuranosyltransferase